MKNWLYPALVSIALYTNHSSACTVADIAAYNYVEGGATWICTPFSEKSAVSCQVNDFSLEFELDPTTGNFIAIMDLQRSDVPIQQIELPVDPSTCAFTEGTQTIINRRPAQRTPYVYRLGEPILVDDSNKDSDYDSVYYQTAELTFRRINDCSEVAAEYGFPSKFGALLSGEGYDGSENFACTLESNGHSVHGAFVQDTPSGPRAIVHLELVSREDVIFEAAIDHWSPFETYAFLNPEENRLYAWRRDLGESSGSFLALLPELSIQKFDNLGFSRGVINGLIGQSPENLSNIGIDIGIDPVGPSSSEARSAVVEAIRKARPEFSSDGGWALHFDSVTGGRGDVGLRLEDFRVMSCDAVGPNYRCDFQTRAIVPYRFTSGDRQLLSFLGIDPDQRYEPLSVYITADFFGGPDGAWSVDLDNEALLRLGAYHEPVADRMAQPQSSSGRSAIDCAGSALMPAYVGAMRGC